MLVDPCGLEAVSDVARAGHGRRGRRQRPDRRPWTPPRRRPTWRRSRTRPPRPDGRARRCPGRAAAREKYRYAGPEHTLRPGVRVSRAALGGRLVSGSRRLEDGIETVATPMAWAYGRGRAGGGFRGATERGEFLRISASICVDAVRGRAGRLEPDRSLSAASTGPRAAPQNPLAGLQFGLLSTLAPLDLPVTLHCCFPGVRQTQTDRVADQSCWP